VASSTNNKNDQNFPPPYDQPPNNNQGGGGGSGGQMVMHGQQTSNSLPPAPRPPAFNYPTSGSVATPKADEVKNAEMMKIPITGGVPSAPPIQQLPNLPDVPADQLDDERENQPKDENSIDFDDLSRRFENLKKRR
jgi:hypothetical protein